MYLLYSTRGDLHQDAVGVQQAPDFGPDAVAILEVGGVPPSEAFDAFWLDAWKKRDQARMGLIARLLSKHGGASCDVRSSKYLGIFVCN